MLLPEESGGFHKSWYCAKQCFDCSLGQELEKISFGFFTRSGKYVECLLCVSNKLDREDSVAEVFCFLRLASHELQQAPHVQWSKGRTALNRVKIIGLLWKSDQKSTLMRDYIYAEDD